MALGGTSPRGLLGRVIHHEHSLTGIRGMLPCVVEPPKLYVPHVPIIVLQTSDWCTHKPYNPDSLSGVLREPRIIHILQLIHDQHGVTITLQQLI